MRRLLTLLVIGFALRELARLLNPQLRRAPPPPPPSYRNDYSGPVRIACGETGKTAEITYTGDPSSLVLVRVERQCGSTPVAIRAREPDAGGLGDHIVPEALLRTDEADPKPRTYAVQIPRGHTLVLSCGGGVGGGECVFHVQKLTSADSEWRLWTGYSDGDNRQRVTGPCGDNPISGRFYNLARSQWIRVNWRTHCGAVPRIRFVPIGGTGGTWIPAQNDACVENMDNNTRLEVRCPAGSGAGPCAFEVYWLPRHP